MGQIISNSLHQELNKKTRMMNSCRSIGLYISSMKPYWGRETDTLASNKRGAMLGDSLGGWNREGEKGEGVTVPRSFSEKLSQCQPATQGCSVPSIPTGNLWKPREPTGIMECMHRDPVFMSLPVQAT